MSAEAQMLAFEADCQIFSDTKCGFPAPGLHTFMYEPLFTVGGFEFDKPMLLAFTSTLVVVGFFWAAFNKPKVVPGKLQLVGEAGYDFVRRGVVYEIIGKKDGEKYVPLMVSLFFFIWIMNLWSIIPIAQFPVTSLIAYPAVLAIIVYIVWLSITFKKHGFVGGWKNITGYNKELGPILPLVVVLEFFSNLLIRPFTHAVRLFANMFAGHLLIVMFSLATYYLLNGIGILYAGTSFILVMAMIVFELFIQAVQAYVFVLLASSYIQGALAEHH
ncbi:F0F1 ATP synthase subunit A [Streptomyces sp. NPDC004838]